MTTPAENNAPVFNAGVDQFLDPNDPAAKRRKILQSIADKQARSPAVDSQGQPIPGKLRWGQQ